MAKVVRTAKKKEYSKAMRMLDGHGVAPFNEDTAHQLQSYFPSEYHIEGNNIRFAPPPDSSSQHNTDEELTFTLFRAQKLG